MAKIAGALGQLRAQLQAACPRVPQGEFGWVASAEHTARNPDSDHEPDSRGIVHALDIPHYPSLGLDCAALFEHLRKMKDPRLKYCIFNLKIFGDAGYARRNRRTAYTLYPASGHTEHMHVSVNVAGEDDENSWDIGAIGDTEPSGPPATVRPILRRGSTGEHVRLVQSLIMSDGIFGAETESAVRRFQREQGTLDIDGIVGPATWAALERLMEPEEPSVWLTDITATVFGGKGDEQPVAYSDVTAGWADRPGVALPYRFTGARPKVEVRNAAGKVIVASIVDVGPWETNDPYWETNSRPKAESGMDSTGRKTNKAGIDLTPALARELGVDGKGLVSWRFV